MNIKNRLNVDYKLAQEYSKGNKTFVTDLSRNIKVGYNV